MVNKKIQEKTKLLDRQELNKVVMQLQEQGQRIVFTNGCFDIIHAGHVRYLSEARSLGDFLVVGLNSDASVKRLKGPERPINHELDRAEVLAGLWAVDAIVIFDESTAESLVEYFKPQIYVKGGDYELKNLPEAKLVETYGGKTVLIPEVPGRSSSKVIEQIRKRGAYI